MAIPIVNRNSELHSDGGFEIGATKTDSRINLVSSSVLAGVGLFYLNSLGKSLVGLPLAEFGLAALLVMSPRASPRRTPAGVWLAAWLVVGSLASIAVVSDILNGLGPVEISKDGTRLLLLFAPALLYGASARPDWFLGVALGLVLASSTSAALATASTVVDRDAAELLKIALPMPGIVLMSIISTRRVISRPLLMVLSVGLAAVVAGATLSGSRNALLSLVIVGGVWAINRLVPPVSLGAVLVGGLMPWIPIVLVWTLPVVDFLYAADIVTASNLERSVSLLVGWDLIESSPITGSGLAAFPGALSDALQGIAGRQGFALDPHNFYMQVGVAFGIPAMLLVTVTALGLFRWGFALSAAPRWQRGACILLLGWLAMITPLAGSERLMWVVAWILLVSLPTTNLLPFGVSQPQETRLNGPNPVAGFPVPPRETSIAANRDRSAQPSQLRAGES